MLASRRCCACVYAAAARGLTRVYSNLTNAPAQFVDKTSKDAVKDILGNLSLTNRFPGGRYDTLDKYGTELTELARRGIIDPVVGRDDEIERCIDILSQKTKNNPVIVGETSVGKTAIAEGLAQRIFRGDVPEPLRNQQLFSVDIGSLLVGAMYPGQFEERIKHVIREVAASKGQIILFIDEIHTVVGAIKEVIQKRQQRNCVVCLELDSGYLGLKTAGLFRE